MPKQLPVPVTFRLPSSSWTAVEPEAYGVTNAAFLALRDGLGGSYRPSIVVSGDVRDDGATVTEIADEAVAKLAQETGGTVVVEDRTVTESDTAPTAAQRLLVEAEIDGSTEQLVQMQVIGSYADASSAARRAVVIHTLSCLAEQAESVAPEFRTYLASIEFERLAGDGAPQP